MTKDMNVWAVKLNSHIVELRATVGPVKVIRSHLKKAKATKWSDYDYTVYPPKRVDKFKDFTFKQTTLVGGRFIGKLAYNRAIALLGVSFSKDDVVKLTIDQKAIIFSHGWRKLYL